LFRKRIIFDLSDVSDEVIDVHSDYVVQNISACYGNKVKCFDIDVIVDSDVDTSLLGSYRVVYTASYNKKRKKFIKKVMVVDNQKPEINVESSSILVCPNVDDYDVSFSAIDNYDGDLTSSVVKNVFDSSLILSVSDSSGNSSSKEITVNKDDVEAPSIKLLGEQTMYVLLNSVYSDPGYEAVDNCDGDISNKVSVEGNVNSSIVGSYNIVYSVTDSSGNSSSITRVVNVYSPSYNSKVIYLTFDDGPTQYTGELLNILSKYNVKATFFVTGMRSNYFYYIGEAYRQGHSIALHSNTHNYSYIYSSVDAYFNDLSAISEIVKNQTGNYSKLVRFPGGGSNTVSRNYSLGIMSTLSRMLNERGYKYFDWNVSSGDAGSTVLSSEEYARNVINGLGDGSYYIVLQHDTNINSIRAVSSIIEYGISHGYSFKALDLNSPTVHHRIAN
jgi:peptidoglycan/xylan/chitin deacetylase (PgdA/CDA1 family)